jgi:hypothetical protein
MVKRPQKRLLVGGGALLAVILLYLWLRPSAPAAPPPAAATRGGRRAASGGDGRIGRIGLDRLKAVTPAEPAVQRDLFAFGSLPTPPPTAAPPPVVVADATPMPEMPPTPPPLPPLNVRYIGSLETKRGLRVAFFQTEKKDIVTGQVGEVVMNRFKIVKIGFESADIQEVGVDQVRRLPLRGGS